MKFEQILVFLTIFTAIGFAIEQILQRAQKFAGQAYLIRESLSVCRSFFPVFLLVLVLRSFVYEGFRIPSGSMKPTLFEGDFIAVNKYNYGLKLPLSGHVLLAIGNPQRGDVIVFRHHQENIDMIKRVIGIPGDRISYKNNKLYINELEVYQEYKGMDIEYDELHKHSRQVKLYTEKLDDLAHNIYNLENDIINNYKYSEVTVPEGSYFVLGDNRSNSQDSRYWGFVKEKQIIGQAKATLLSIDFNNWVLRTYRMGKKII